MLEKTESLLRRSLFTSHQTLVRAAQDDVIMPFITVYGVSKEGVSNGGTCIFISWICPGDSWVCHVYVLVCPEYVLMCPRGWWRGRK